MRSLSLVLLASVLAVPLAVGSWVWAQPQEAAQKSAAGKANAKSAASAEPAAPLDLYYQPRLALKADGSSEKPPVLRVEPVSDKVRTDFRLPEFYQKMVVYQGIPIIGSSVSRDQTFLECAYMLDNMLYGRTKVIDALVASRVRLVIMAATEYTLDIPENRSMAANGAFYDRRARGLGAMPAAICAEENVLNLHGDPYNGENITLHEFSHIVASAMNRADPDWYRRLREIYRQAMSENLWKVSYSTNNEQEYWAEGTQSWFDCNLNINDQWQHNGIWNREKLKAYDPRLAGLLEETFGDQEWRYVRTTLRPVADNPHLAGINRAQIPFFSFLNSPRIQEDLRQDNGKQFRAAESKAQPPNRGKQQGKTAKETSGKK